MNTEKKLDPIAAQLCERFGCHACKHQITEDDFLLAHERFWCAKRKQSYGKDDAAHGECATWTFSGNAELLKAVTSNQDPLPFDDEPEEVPR